MSCTPAPTCRSSLQELSKRFPGRSTASDGICASSAHHGQNPSSDHETGDAFDATHDPAHGFDSYKAADWLRDRVLEGTETRVKYIISNRRIFNPSVSKAWRNYSGSNPHDHHVHVSLKGGPHSPASVRGDVRYWWDGFGGGEDDVTDEQDKMLRAVWKALYKKQGDTDVEHLNLIDDKLDEVLTKLDAIGT